jgi:chromosome segregation ATPase
LPKLNFSQEEILARVEVLDRKHAELDKRITALDAAFAEERALASTVQAALDKLRADVAVALEREQRMQERIDRVGSKVDTLINVASAGPLG